MKNQNKIVSVIISLTLFTIGGFWYYNNVYKPIERPQEYMEEQTKDLETSELKAVAEGGLAYITGIVTNNGEKQYLYAQVEINLYDKDGALIESTLANINNLEPYGTWKFKALISNPENINSYKLKGITAY